ncbi:MAG: alpha/beta fold hydrolase [Vicinamibacterales bacterium]
MTDRVLTFGPYRLDPAAGHVYRGDHVVALTPKAFALLHYLAVRAGRLVPKTELFSALWPDVFVGDAVLKSSIRELRKALGDDAGEPRFIETAHRRGYRFIAPVVAADVTAMPPVAAPRVSYAHSGHVNIAYQVIGSGPIDLVFVMGWVSHLECFWTEPSFASFLERLSGMARLILFDKRGTGLSDRVSLDQLPTLEQRMDDVRAVMEAAGSRRAVLLGVSEGGPLCSLFAATHPDRTEALVMIGSYARRLVDVDYPWGVTSDERDRFCQTILDEWGGPVGVDDRAPSRADDPGVREWWASYLRMGASPGAAVALTRMNAAIDIRGVLTSVRVPTLVLHRSGDRCLKVEEGRYLASHIAGARFVEQPGDDHLPFVGDQDAMLAEIERFLATRQAPASVERVLATVLTIRVEGGVAPVRHAFEEQVQRARGHLVESAPDRLVAYFDGPGRAVTSGTLILDAARASGVVATAGVHIGECAPALRGGPVFDVSADLAALAAPYEVCVSRTVVDLVPGSGIEFRDRGILQPSASARDLPVYAVADLLEAVVG